MDNERVKAAKRARAFYKNKSDKNEYLKMISDFYNSDDEDIIELGDLIEHEPKVGNWFGGKWLGVSKDEYEKHMMKIDELISKLESG